MTSVEHNSSSEPLWLRKKHLCPETLSHMGDKGNHRLRAKPSMIIPGTAQNINTYSEETAEATYHKCIAYSLSP